MHITFLRNLMFLCSLNLFIIIRFLHIQRVYKNQEYCIIELDLSKIKIRLVNENDISALYDMLKEFRKIPNACIHERPLPSYEDSKKYVMKYLDDNQNHELDKWYIVTNSEEKILGSVNITNKNYINYQILIPFFGQGIGTRSVDLLMQENPRPRYFTIIHQKNEKSQSLSKKLGFTPKGVLFEKIMD